VLDQFVVELRKPSLKIFLKLAYNCLEEFDLSKVTVFMVHY